MIFAMIKTYRDAKKGIKDPGSFGEEMALDVIKIPLVIFTIVGILILALFFILGYTELLMNSIGIFKFLFFLTFIVFFSAEVLTWTLFLKIKKIVHMTRTKIETRANVIEVDIED